MDCIMGDGDRRNLPHDLSFPVLSQAARYLSTNDVRNCELVCQTWRIWMSCLKEDGKASLVFHIPHVVEKIFCHLTLKEQLESRLITEAFDLVASKHLVFKPILTDTTKASILKMGPDLRIDEIRAVGLYTPLAVDNEGKLTCSFNTDEVKSLIFFEGVSAANKITLLKSLHFLQVLRCISATDHSSPPGGSNLQFLRVLEIRASVYDESGSLTSFLAYERFPSLCEIELHLYTRLDYILYFEVHRFIAAHLGHLKKLILSFASDFTFVRENVTNMFRDFPADLHASWLQVAEIFEYNERVLDCKFRFLRCEGFGRFNLTTVLFGNQQQLNPGAILLFHGPAHADDAGNADEDENDEDEEIDPEQIEDEVPDEGHHIEYRYAMAPAIEDSVDNEVSNPPQDGEEQLRNMDPDHYEDSMEAANTSDNEEYSEDEVPDEVEE